jgi:pyruvate/2-oxoglutarate dehydrogenase complex dihydrolipoamide acyltransferase (E2) component
MTAIVLPQAAWEDVEEGTEALLDEWLVAEGEKVEAGQVLARVVLVKANHDVEAPESGKIISIKVAEEENFSQGVELAVLS